MEFFFFPFSPFLLSFGRRGNCIAGVGGLGDRGCDLAALGWSCIAWCFLWDFFSIVTILDTLLTLICAGAIEIIK